MDPIYVLRFLRRAHGNTEERSVTVPCAELPIGPVVGDYIAFPYEDAIRTLQVRTITLRVGSPDVTVWLSNLED
jgi:hypothetical protein